MRVWEAMVLRFKRSQSARTWWCEIHGGTIGRHGIESEIAKHTYGGLVTDSRGVYDEMTRNLSSLHGLRSSRAGLELTIAVQQALRLGTQLRRVNGMAMLADGMTKANAKKFFLNFLLNRQCWSVVHDENFTAGRKVHKAILPRNLAAQVNTA